MGIQARKIITNNRKHAILWYRLALLLALTALILSACGGGAESGDAQQTGSGDGDDTSLSSVSAEDKGTLEYGTPATGSVANGAAHSYQFTGASGENILVRIEATGITF
jgi:hypothetical protein